MRGDGEKEGGGERGCRQDAGATPKELSPRMNLSSTDRLHFEGQLAYARAVTALLALLCLLELRPARDVERPLSFLIAYLVLSAVVAGLERVLRSYNWRLPLVCDIGVLAIFLYISPELLPSWFLLFFVAFASGYRWQLRFSLTLCFGLLLLGLALNARRTGPMEGPRFVMYTLPFFAASFLGASAMAFLGDRNRRFAAQQEFLGRLSTTMHVDLGLAESLRLLLEEMCGEFKSEGAILAFRDVPLTRADGLLLDDMDASLCWNSMEGTGSGFGWDRRNGQALKNLPRMPGPTQQDFGIKNFLSVAFEQEEKPAGRLFLLNRKSGEGPYTKEELAWFERIAVQVSASLENVFLLRHLRARAIEAERSRISRDLHDGILQTLLSIEIQLDVSGELRHMVTDLRPLRVQSADMVDLMNGFGERFRNESGIALDLLVNSAELHAPDRVCREVFQIYREALNNIKKHAKASHVVVKLTQDDSRLVLVVDDNGEGFSFAGRFTGDELDRLRLGPISIKERTRTVGGMLTVESNPGHGARLTIEVPLG